MRPRASTLPDPDLRLARSLAHGFTALLCLTTGLIVLGALVRAHGAGLACPDWPLCFGRWVPRFDLKVGFEWSHRLVAGVVSLLFVALGLALLRRPGTRRAAGRLWAVAALLLGVQVVLGALTVWHLLAEWTVTSHLVTGNAFNVALLLLVLRLRAPDAAPGPAVPPALRAWVGGAALLLTLQIVLGGLVSSGYAGLACPDWPRCLDGRWFPSLRGPVGLHLAHRMNAYLLLAALTGASLAARRLAPRTSVAALCGVAALLGLAQVAVGVANVLLRIPVEVTALHSALAAGLVLTVAAAVHAAWRGAPGAGGTPASC